MEVVTKARQVEQHLRNAIQLGELNPGDPLPPERELLQQFGVSRATLRDALNLLASDGMIIRKQRSGTFIADITKTTGTCIGIVARSTQLTSHTGHIYQQGLEYARKIISAADMRPLIFIGDGGTTEEFLSSINLLDAQVVKEMAGVLLMADVGEMERQLTEKRIPCVKMGHALDHRVRYQVLLDTAKMVEMGVKQLHAHGYFDFAIMYTDYSNEPLRNLSKYMYDTNTNLYRSVVAFRDDRAIPVPWSLHYEHAYEAFKEWWKQPNRPKAIFFSDDALFDASARAMLELGIRVPEDLAVITLANVGRKFAFPVPVCGVGFDPAKRVSAAWGMLSRLIAGEEVDPPVVYVQPELKDGQSL